MNALKAFALTALLVPALATPVFAAPSGPDNGPRNKKERPAMTQEQRDKYAALRKEFDAKATPLRDKLHGKLLELEAVQNLSGTTRDDITKIITEITTLRSQLHAEHQNFRESLAKEGLPSSGRGMGCDCSMMGGGMMGHGMGGGMMGHGMGGGYHGGKHQ